MQDMQAAVSIPTRSQTVSAKNAPSAPAQRAGRRGGNAWQAGWVLAAVDGATLVQRPSASGRYGGRGYQPD